MALSLKAFKCLKKCVEDIERIKIFARLGFVNEPTYFSDMSATDIISMITYEIMS